MLECQVCDENVILMDTVLYYHFLKPSQFWDTLYLSSSAPLIQLLRSSRIAALRFTTRWLSLTNLVII